MKTNKAKQAVAAQVLNEMTEAEIAEQIKNG